jgi:hypothetical protein
MGKYRQLRQQVLANLPQIALLDAPSASDGELALAHEPAYVQSVIDGSLAAQMLREIGFPGARRWLSDRAGRLVPR